MIPRAIFDQLWKVLVESPELSQGSDSPMAISNGVSPHLAKLLLDAGDSQESVLPEVDLDLDFLRS